MEIERAKNHGNTNQAAIVCERCIFWLAFDAIPNQKGECRRHAPVANPDRPEGNLANKPYWPIVAANDYCGDGYPVNTRVRESFEEMRAAVAQKRGIA